MKDKKSREAVTFKSGDELLRLLAALDNPHRLRILGELAGGRQYISELARKIKISRPLIHIHLQKLEAAGLVTATYEVSREGKALKYYEVTKFVLRLTPSVIREAARNISNKGQKEEK